MRILVLGGDGYLGWPTALHLSGRGHDVAVADSFVRRQYDHELGVHSLVPIEPLHVRTRAWQEVSGRSIGTFVGDLTDAEFSYRIVREFRPDTIVHYAEQRAAPYSEIDRKHAVYTQVNNLVGTLNLLYAIAEIDRDIHLVKLGTMGEYGTPDIDIEEGWLEVTHKGRTDRMLYPKRPGSFYHLSKVHDSHNIEFACRTWGLRATDLNQGIVYGQQTPQTAQDPRLATRFDYDAVFGTVLNRFVVQAVLGQPLTVYGEGGQTRGVNPRVEAGSHYYNVVHTGLMELGLQPHRLSDTLITSLFDIAERHKHRADLAALRPTVDWRRTASSTRPGSFASQE
jgi:UDP-sulfoquinovose synthase